MKHLKILVGIIMMLVLPTVVFPGQESDVKDFWHSFRQAVLRNSIDQISALTHFPFEVRGPDDSDPIIFYDKKGFRSIFKQVVVQPVYVRSNGKSLVKSMLQVIEEKPDIIPADYLTSEGSSSRHVGEANIFLKSSLPAMRYAMQIMLSGFR